MAGWQNGRMAGGEERIAIAILQSCHSAILQLHRPPRPVRSLRLQSNGLYTTWKVFAARNSRSVVRSLGLTNASTARSIGLRFAKVEMAPAAYVAANSFSRHEKMAFAST